MDIEIRALFIDLVLSWSSYRAKTGHEQYIAELDGFLPEVTESFPWAIPLRCWNCNDFER